MMKIYGLLARVATVLPIENVGKGEEEAPVATGSALSWVILIGMLALVMFIGLKNSRRTHLD
jgi:hypothetical protein